MPPPQPLLILGVPRSGSTWLVEVLACATRRTLALEPDDSYRWPEALEAKRGLGDYPTAPSARGSASFRSLWRLVLEEPHRFSKARRDAETERLAKQPLAVTRAAVGDSRSSGLDQGADQPVRPLAPPAGELLIKTVNVALCADVVSGWLGAKVVVISRALRSVISSWSRLPGFEPEDLHLDPWVRERVLQGIDLPPLTTRLERIAWTVATLDRALGATSRAQRWLHVSHEDLVADPHGGIPALVSACGLPCDDRVHDFIRSLQKPGSGFEICRSMEQIQGWEGRLTAAEWAQVDGVLRHFPRRAATT